jgi:hypothetical protein
MNKRYRTPPIKNGRWVSISSEVYLTRMYRMEAPEIASTAERAFKNPTVPQLKDKSQDVKMIPRVTGRVD